MRCASPAMAALACAVLAAGPSCRGAEKHEEQHPVEAAAAAPAPPRPEPPGRAALLPSLAPLVDEVRGAVVNVEVVSRAEAPSADEDLLRLFGLGGQGGGSGAREMFRRGAGSGFIVDPAGFILTNNHVVERATSIRVRLEDGRAFDAKVAGRDALTDVAVIRLQHPAEKLPVARLGDSDAVRVGDWVTAIGNPFGLASSVSVGIISAKARNIQAGPYDDFLQTDAAINPGNSGGPLFDTSGAVVGMNTAIVGGGTGIGFAVPSNILKALLPQLEKGQEIQRGWLGVSVQDLTPDLATALGAKVEKGAVVTGVGAGTPAAKAGLKPDDIIVGVGGKPVDSASALTRVVGFEPPGASLTLHVRRGGQPQDVQVELGARPHDEGGSAQQRVAPEERHDAGNLGLAFQDAARMGAGPGAVVTEVRPGSAADEAGLVPGMVIVEAGGRRVQGARDLADALSSGKKGAVILLRVQVGDARVLRALRLR